MLGPKVGATLDDGALLTLGVSDGESEGRLVGSVLGLVLG